MSTAEQKIEAKLEQFHVAYRQTLSATLDELRAFVIDFNSGAMPFDRREELSKIAHKLTGSAGTYGYDRTSDAARTLEDIVSVENHDFNIVQAEAAYKALLHEIKQALSGSPQSLLLQETISYSDSI